VPAQRADARRNRAAILSAAWALFEEGGETSMAAVARRAGVGMATLYLELVLAVAAIRGPVDYVEPILQTALDGLLWPTADRPDERR